MSNQKKPGPTDNRGTSSRKGEVSGKGTASGRGAASSGGKDPRKGAVPNKSGSSNKGAVPNKSGSSNKNSAQTKMPAPSKAIPSNKESVRTRETAKRTVSREHLGHLQTVRRKRAISSALFMVIVVLLLAVVTASAIFYVKDYVAAKPKFAFVTQGSVEHSVSAEVLIIRREAVVSSNTSGSLVTLSTEGSRVSKTQRLAMVIPEGMEDTVIELSGIQSQIVEIERDLVSRGKGMGAVAVYNETAAEIIPLIDMIRVDSFYGDLSNLTSYSASLQVLMDKRDSRLQSIDFDDERLSTLRTNKIRLEQELAAESAIISAIEPGIVSFKLDGLEKELTPETLMTIASLECDKYIKNAQRIIFGDLDIVKDQPVLRICQNELQYFACVIPGMGVSDFPKDSVHTIRVPSEGIVINDCLVIRSSEAIDGVFVVFESQNQIERLLDRRTAEVEIVRSVTEGLRVPRTALIKPDYELGYAKILINSSGYARSLSVKILDYDREYAIISPIQGFNDPNTSTIVITNPNTLSEDEKVE
ncbi:MAG: hypothetical protein JW817_05780 [Clostridiales bacterium]|nr:hypothetical protein [Clostridiales bacterium]